MVFVCFGGYFLVLNSCFNTNSVVQLCFGCFVNRKCCCLVVFLILCFLFHVRMECLLFFGKWLSLLLLLFGVFFFAGGLFYPKPFPHPQPAPSFAQATLPLCSPLAHPCRAPLRSTHRSGPRTRRCHQHKPIRNYWCLRCYHLSVAVACSGGF